jgi:hyperosmotically inducible periplasmic protein
MRAFLIVVLLCVVAFFAFGLWSSGSLTRTAPATSTVATTGKVDTATARERGAELAEKAAVATEKVKETVGEARLTAKIKAKMALDDHVKARQIDVTTNGSTVTLSGTVGSDGEHDRAIRLARETDGITQVIDHLRIER